jgi:hypothetical protein
MSKAPDFVPDLEKKGVFYAGAGALSYMRAM